MEIEQQKECCEGQYEEQQYFSYGELQNNFESQNPEEIFIYLSKQQELLKDDWKIEFQFYNELRIVNKYYPQNLKLFLSSFSKQISFGACHLRSQIQKNAVIFIQEVFDTTLLSDIDMDKEIPDDFINTVIPVIFDCSVSSKIFVKKEAQKVISFVEKNKYQKEMLQELIDTCFHKNSAISEQASKSIINYLEYNQNSLKDKLEQNQLTDLIESTVKLYNGKRSLLNKNSVVIAKLISKCFGNSEIQEFATQHFKAQTAQTFIKIVEEKPVRENKPKPSLKDLIKNKQTQAQDNQDLQMV